MNLGETFNKFQKSIQESSGFPFAKHYADDLSKSELICLLTLLVWSRIRKLWGKRTSALNFASVQISNFKHSTGLNVIYHDQMDISKHAWTNFLKIFFFVWNILSKVGQSMANLWPLCRWWPVYGHYADDLSKRLRQPKSYFSWRVTWKRRPFDALKRQTTRCKLILVDTSWY